jgi:hypothetical protein
MVSGGKKEPVMVEAIDDCESGACAIWYY